MYAVNDDTSETGNYISVSLENALKFFNSHARRFCSMENNADLTLAHVEGMRIRNYQRWLKGGVPFCFRCLLSCFINLSIMSSFTEGLF